MIATAAFFATFTNRSLSSFSLSKIFIRLILIQAALDSAMASMALGVGGDADWQQQLQLAASAHGGDWTGEFGETERTRRRLKKEAASSFSFSSSHAPAGSEKL